MTAKSQVKKDTKDYIMFFGCILMFIASFVSFLGFRYRLAHLTSEISDLEYQISETRTEISSLEFTLINEESALTNEDIKDLGFEEKENITYLSKKSFVSYNN